MTIEARPTTVGGMALVEYSREGVPTTYLLRPDDAAAVEKIRTEHVRWRAIKEEAFLTGKRKEKR